MGLVYFRRHCPSSTRALQPTRQTGVGKGARIRRRDSAIWCLTPAEGPAGPSSLACPGNTMLPRVEAHEHVVDASTLPAGDVLERNSRRSTLAENNDFDKYRHVGFSASASSRAMQCNEHHVLCNRSMQFAVRLVRRRRPLKMRSGGQLLPCHSQFRDGCCELRKRMLAGQIRRASPWTNVVLICCQLRSSGHRLGPLHEGTNELTACRSSIVSACRRPRFGPQAACIDLNQHPVLT